MPDQDSLLAFRPACHADIPDILDMYHDDHLGLSSVENGTPKKTIEQVFESICSDKNQELMVVEKAGEVVATFHLTFIQYLNFGGGRRVQVDCVRTKSTHRRQGIGRQMFQYVIDRARSQGCLMVQLAADKEREDTRGFYESFGFVHSHTGYTFTLK